MHLIPPEELMSLDAHVRILTVKSVLSQEQSGWDPLTALNDNEQRRAPRQVSHAPQSR